MKRTFALGIALLLLASLSVLAQGGKSPIPSDADQQQALAAAKEVFGEDYKAARSAEQKSLLAGKILAQSAESKGDGAARYVLLRLAKDIAVQAGDPDLVRKALDEMANAFNIDARQSKLDAFFTLAKQVPPAKRSSLISWATKLLSETVADDDFDNAKKVFSVLQAAARQSRDRTVNQQVTEMGRELGEIARAYEAIKASTATENFPNDPAASLAVGRYQCFSKGNWAQGLDVLKHASDEKLRALAAKELEGTVGKEVALADQWWDVSESLDGRGRDVVQLHAADLYRKALPQLTGLDKARIEKRLAGVKAVVLIAEEQATPAALVSALPRGAILVLTFEPNTFFREGNRIFVKDLSGKNNHAGVLGVSIVDGKVGKAMGTQNSSEYVFPTVPLADLPRTVCFWIKADNQTKLGRHFVFWWNEGTFFLQYMKLSDKGTSVFWTEPFKGVCNPDETWHHHAYLYDGKEQRYYVDAKMVRKSDKPLNTGGAMLTTHSPVMQGSIDELAVFDRALTEEEIKQVYELGVNGQNLARRK